MNILTLKYCPRTRHSEGRHALKKPHIHCPYRRNFLIAQKGDDVTFCGCWPALLKYIEANKINLDDYKPRFSVHFKCVLEATP